MQALYNHFRDLMIEAQAKTDKSYELIAKKRATIKRLEKQIEKLEKNIYYYPSWVKEVLIPLGQRITERIGLPFEIYGPFGLACETSLYFRADMSKSICDQPTKHITVLPEFGDNRTFYLLYYTGERDNTYEDGSIGALNGFNNRRAPLPDDFEAILEIVNKNSVDGHE